MIQQYVTIREIDFELFSDTILLTETSIIHLNCEFSSRLLVHIIEKQKAETIFA